ncbi:hypothetical protein KP509_02G111700 [Ceratopteris richardii]|uniref:Bifunctional inhibitor/plant lipid transfer protein/seed storage helical domain-containing protein n=1 Tax=Ceratopteris richardii TaxID=49495 RepID=A0A8T2VH49_CERRI|nr:hypothetical protein KP509_1Z212600 [Ceratopteris richardii]KAH7445186.1 hypothetical protein KP509_02G111700 [Ceratopteris richardii]
MAGGAVMAVSILMAALVVLASADETKLDHYCSTTDGDVENLKFLCVNFLVGETPPTPWPFGPCCKAARTAKAELRCLCSAIDFSDVSALSLARFNIFCAVDLACGLFP